MRKKSRFEIRVKGAAAVCVPSPSRDNVSVQIMTNFPGLSDRNLSDSRCHSGIFSRIMIQNWRWGETSRNKRRKWLPGREEETFTDLWSVKLYKHCNCDSRGNLATFRLDFPVIWPPPVHISHCDLIYVYYDHRLHSRAQISSINYWLKFKLSSINPCHHQHVLSWTVWPASIEFVVN